MVTTNFVNPMQFGPTEDLARYPRTLDADLALCEAVGVDLVWAPTRRRRLPARRRGDRHRRARTARRPARGRGAARATSPACSPSSPSFSNLVRPGRAYFGEKDYQQLTLIRQMAADLDLDAAIVGVPTVREPDGLALSSRNVYLSAAERRHALALSRALFAGRDAAAEPARSP